MANSRFSKVSTIYIYAIAGYDIKNEFCVYIGKTKTANLRKVLSYHRRKGKLTSPLFYDTSKPEIYLLESLHTNEATAYKHCVAWCRYFLENDIDVLCYPGTYEDAYDLLPETEEIYANISCHSVEATLLAPYSPSTNIPSSPAPISGEKSFRLSIRLRESEYNAFAQLCSDNDYTQREGLILLLSNVVGDPPATALIQEQKNTISHMETQIKQLSKTPRGVKTNQHLKNMLAFCQSGISQYIKCIFPDVLSTQSSRCHSWNEAVRQLSNRKEYHYPNKSGFFLMRFQYMCYGQSHRNNAPIFLYGIDITHDTPVLLRYYAKPEVSGVKPPHSPFFTKGTVFLVGCLVASGVADMYAAYPIPLESSFESNVCNPQVASIDDILQNALQRSL